MDTELRIQTYLRNGGSLSDLTKDPYNIHIKVDGDLVGFKYNQIKSKLGNSIVQECRGLILDRANDWNVVCFPFSKFFNIQEGFAADIDWSTARVFHKYDGTCAPIYHYDNKWFMHTLGTIKGEGPVICDGNISKEFDGDTFADLFWHAWSTVYPSVKLEDLDPDLNYMFELITPYNRIVTRYDSFMLPLIGVRNRVTLVEQNIDDFSHLFNVAEYVEFGKIDSDLISAAVEFLPDDKEGYVVCDRDFNRVKIKSPTYLALSKMKDNALSRRNGVLTLVLKGREDDFIGSYPEFEADVLEIKQKIIRLADYLTSIYDRIGGPSIDPDNHTQRKWFAMDVKSEAPGTTYGLFFSVLTGKYNSFLEAIQDSKPELVDKMLNQLEND